ncbi:WD repeat-containing protein 97 isoform X2 [Tamandua tetradactyla]|uniref:WD repeat-containing protein 97 isoform X2 n=1 Tax=Tamandua tetradactyla TaxID=48850 RepID=UPI0040540C4E
MVRGGAGVRGGASGVRYLSNGLPGRFSAAVGLPGPSAAPMESEVSDAANPFSGESDNLALETDLYDTDVYEVPDPGLLKEKNEPSFSETQQALHYFATHPQWRMMTMSARARQLWLLLRKGLHGIVEKEKRAELHVACLTHGLEPLRRLELAAGLRSVAQDPAGGRLVVLDGAGCLHLHREDGWAHEKLLAPVALTGLVTVPGSLGDVGRFVGWGPVGLAILGTDLRLLWLSKPGAGREQGCEPICCLLVPQAGLLLVAEAGGSIALWRFRSGSRRLMQCGVPLQLPPSPAGPLSRLALGPPRPYHAPRCFAAYGSAVLTLDLHAWALVDVRRDLHKTTISDLAYCEAVEAMVTASRDSTVKVWEANWQIRMVFVGHGGPVTAIAVLPNTALVLSASQDGTLRTWDLQAAAQVGEVARCSWDAGDLKSRRVSRLLAPARPGWPVLSLSASAVELWQVRELYSPLAQLPAPVLHLHLAPPLPAPAFPALPMRLVCACADGSVCLVSASTGHVVCALLLGSEDCAAAVAYCLPREVLWLLTRSGHLVRANAACYPMRVLHRVCPPPAPAPRPCCLHLYNHLTDPASARTSWELVRQHGGELDRSDAAGAWKDKNRYLPVVGCTDGALLVLDWRSSQTVFHTEAHSPGPVTAIASTWNCVVSSGGDLTVKMWRVFPYAEESLSLLRTFSCCHPAVVLCPFGTRVTVGFEAPASATYGLVQFCLRNSRRFDHRPQDDPTDHITGLCCCPMLKLYASSSLDCTVRIWSWENRLLRLLQLNGAPQALAFCSSSGDLMMALGSRLCLVAHTLYLPTSYLVKKLCRKVPEVVDDPPLPLTSLESLTSAQLQRLASLHRSTSLSAALSPIHHQKATPQQPQPVLEEAIKALAARDHDLQQLRLGLVIPAAQPPLSWQQHQEAFDNYLHLIYGPGLLGMQLGRVSQDWSNVTIPVERDASNVPRRTGVRTKLQMAPKALHPQDLGALWQRLAPRVLLPMPPASGSVHSKASQLLACSSLSSRLGLSLDLQLQSERLQKEMQVALDPSPSHLQPKTPYKKHHLEPLSKLGGFFPATIHLRDKHFLRPLHFPGFVPNSVVLQRLWPQTAMGGAGALAQLASKRAPKAGASWDDFWLSRSSGRHGALWQRKLVQWLGEQPGDEQPAEEETEEELDWSLPSLSSQGTPSEEPLVPLEQKSLSSADGSPAPGEVEAISALSLGPSLWEESFGHLPSSLRFFLCQNWFKKLFPLFTLEAYPEVSTAEGLASLLVGALEAASWSDGVNILSALLRLLPDVSCNLRGRLQRALVHLLNLDRPPSLQDGKQKQFVMLALQLLLACTLESRDVVLELLSYFLYSPAACQPELKKLLSGLGLQDPQGFLFREMVTWVQGSELGCKASLRTRCGQKLEDMVQKLQESLSQAFAVSAAPSSIWPHTRVSETPSQIMLLSAREPQARPARAGRTRRTLSESLQPFSASPGVALRTSAPAVLPSVPLPLHMTVWSQRQILDLESIDALNFFCERQLARHRGLLRKEEKEEERPRSRVPDTVVRQPLDCRRGPIPRLLEAKAQPEMSARGRFLDGAIRILKLPLPRVEPQPFPPDWPTPARPLPPLLLQPALQRYFLPRDADPDSYS